MTIMEAKHTPGPWTHNGAGRIHAGAFTTIADCAGPGFNNKDIGAPYPDNAQANARLIAAAPDLLGFARLVAALEDKCRSEGGRHPTYAEWAVLATSIPAIARATGGGK